jgi:hypothetical protein
MQIGSKREKAVKERKDARKKADAEREQRDRVRAARAEGDPDAALSGAERREKEVSAQWAAHISLAERWLDAPTPEEGAAQWANWAVAGAAIADAIERASRGTRDERQTQAREARRALWQSPMDRLAAQRGSIGARKSVAESCRWALAPVGAFQKIIERADEARGETGALALRKLAGELRSEEAIGALGRSISQALSRDASFARVRAAQEQWFALSEQALELGFKGWHGQDNFGQRLELASQWLAETRRACVEQAKQIGRNNDMGEASASEPAIAEAARKAVAEWLAAEPKILGIVDPSDTSERARAAIAIAREISGFESLLEGWGVPRAVQGQLRASQARLGEQARRWVTEGGKACVAEMFERLDMAEIRRADLSSGSAAPMILSLAGTVDWREERAKDSLAHRNAIEALLSRGLASMGGRASQDPAEATRSLRMGLLQAMVARGGEPWTLSGLVSRAAKLPWSEELAQALRAHQEGSGLRRAVSKAAEQAKASRDAQESEGDEAGAEADSNAPRRGAQRL